MQFARTDLELRAEMPEFDDARSIQMAPRMRIAATAAAIAGGMVAASLLLRYYYLHKRKEVNQAVLAGQ